MRLGRGGGIQKSWVLLTSPCVEQVGLFYLSRSLSVFQNVLLHSVNKVLIEFSGVSFLNLFSSSLQVTRNVSSGRKSIGCTEGVGLKGPGESSCQPGNC